MADVHPVKVATLNNGFTEAMHRIAEANHHDPHQVLGLHESNGDAILTVFAPDSDSVTLLDNGAALQRIGNSDFFQWRGKAGDITAPYRLQRRNGAGHSEKYYDPYSFPVLSSDFDLHLFAEGRHRHCYRFLGAHVLEEQGIGGTRFAVWAPAAARVSVVGAFNDWDGRRHPMRVLGGSGVWELFIPGLGDGELYRFEIRNRDSGAVEVKNDPYTFRNEIRPANAGLVTADSAYQWSDDDWLRQREHADWLKQPMSVYEVHLGSWQRHADGSFLNYREIAERLVPYVRDAGFTHIELLPVTEHPLDQSWGYQTTGYFSVTSRFGSPDDLRFLIDLCHQNAIGVLLDWVPGHFPKDAHALARFDGTALYEHEDPRLGEHADWGTLIFNYGRAEVRAFLIASAVYFLEEFHIDGLRVDAVASMLYLDYSRKEGEWLPNRHGGRENLDAIDFLRELNEFTHEAFPGTLTIAEESTAWPQVSRPVWLGGLGFSMKWNMGWMHDSLEYMAKDPVFRHFHHDQLTFGLLYAFTENFVLPFSHDEVVHMKGALISKMPGDDWQRFANLRLLYTYMWTYPGKKLLFMGCEFAQLREWASDQQLDWFLTDSAPHQGMQLLIRDLNRVYRNTPALYGNEFEGHGFEWIDCHDASQSTIVYLRLSGDDSAVVALNFTPVPRENYRIGVPAAGTYRELLNSDSRFYAGSDVGNGGDLVAEARPWMGRPYSIEITLPPLAGVILRSTGAPA